LKNQKLKQDIFGEKMDRIVIMIIGGSSLGAAIAQIPGAVLAGAIAGSYGLFLALKKEKTITLSEAAIHLNLSQETLEEQVLQGNIPGYQIDNTWHFLKTEIDDWQQTHDKRVIFIKQAGALAGDDNFSGTP
jgi:excisionase family DNA binding protein